MANPANPDITEILRQIAAEEKNCLGDHWSTCYCADAALIIEKLREEVTALNEEIDDLYRDLAGEDG